MRPVRGSGDRAQAIQLGALLLFAILIINLSLYQVFVVPDQNGEIEFKHNQQAQEEMKIVRNTVFQTSVTGTDLTTSVQLAPQYPSRTVFVNPGPPSGSLRTESLGGVSFSGIEPTDEETRQFWDASTPTPTTDRLVYRPNYNLYTAPETVYESSVVFNSGDGAPDRTLTGQSIVNGRRISLVTLTGNVGTTATGSESLEFKGVSASREPIPVRGGSGPLNVTIPTTLAESEWEALLSDQLDGDNTGVGVGSDGDEQYLTSIDHDNSTSPATVTLTFEEGVQYDLRLARVGVGSGVTSPDAAYITDVQSPANVDEGGTVEYVMEVRDELNNPVSGVDVTANATNSPDDIGAFAAGNTTKTTDSDGRVSFAFDAQAGATGTEDLVFNISDADGSGTVEDYELVEQSLTAQSSGGGSGGGGDGTPPAVSNANADPSGISQGQSVDLSARFDDTSGRGGSDIFSSAWNNTNTSDTGTLEATDGQFDQAVEDVDTTITGTSGWPTGENIIRINGTDANGNTKATTVAVTVSGGPVAASLPSDIVYLDDNGNDEGEIQSVPPGPTGSEVTYSTPDEVEGLGPLEADLDGDDAAKEVPCVENSNKNIVVVDSSDNRQTLMDNVGAREQRMAVGDIDADSRVEVLFVGNDNDRLRQVDHADGGTSSEITVNGSSVPASQIVGYEDFNGDGDRDLVYVDDSSVLSYIDNGGNQSTGYGPNDNAALGQPADLDGDGDLELPAVNDNGNIEIVNASGGIEQTITTSAASAPLATVQDLTGDGIPDIAYLDSNNDKIEVISAAGDGSVSYNEKANTDYGAN